MFFYLKDQTFFLFGLCLRRGNTNTDSLIEELLETVFVLSTALDVHHAAKLLGKLVGLFGSYRVKALFRELCEGVCVVAEVLLEPDEQGAGLGAVVADLGVPLLLAVIE